MRNVAAAAVDYFSTLCSGVGDLERSLTYSFLYLFLCLWLVSFGAPLCFALHVRALLDISPGIFLNLKDDLPGICCSLLLPLSWRRSRLLCLPNFDPSLFFALFIFTFPIFQLFSTSELSCSPSLFRLPQIYWEPVSFFLVLACG